MAGTEDRPHIKGPELTSRESKHQESHLDGRTAKDEVPSLPLKRQV